MIKNDHNYWDFADLKFKILTIILKRKKVFMFKLVSDYKPTGDQPKAIDYLVNGINEGKKFQTLLGVTGSRKNIYNGKYYRKNSGSQL